MLDESNIFSLELAYPEFVRIDVEKLVSGRVVLIASVYHSKKLISVHCVGDMFETQTEDLADEK